MERALATIQTIQAIDPIPAADRIETATVLGWKVVVQKGQFHPGDRCIFCEVDSLLPEREAFEFMRPRGFRVKTTLLRGQLSQGLLLVPEDFSVQNLTVGTDVTKQLGIQQYRHPSEDDPDSEVIGPLPGFLPRTKEPRVQSFPGVLDEMQGLQCYISTKLNGKSCTVYNAGSDLLVCGRRGQMLNHADSPYWNAIAAYRLDQKLESEASHYAVQGEVVGPGIRGNQLGLDRLDFRCFNVYEVRHGRYLDYYDFVTFCYEHELETVPLERVNLKFDFTLPELLRMTEGNYDSGHPQEGIVVRPLVEQYSPTLKGRLSFKVLNDQHLLTEE
ncbi:hypothetical protein LCGC14_0889880 [marine sediment metagenome]|uniref:RNA ligase domain-containing protein n=1 Tax=marine sediment metagenome TaxID=412755 RepID=A0A0F9NZL4_9ZZZZ